MQIKLREKFDQLTLLELFQVEPTIANPTDGYWCYESKDAAGTVIQFGIDIIQETVEIDLKILDFSVVTLTFELVNILEIINLDQGKFAFDVALENKQAKTKIQIELRPYIRIYGYTLRQE